MAHRDAKVISPVRQQLDVIAHHARRLIVEANAGSAKTTTIALKVRALLESGTEPAAIALLSFTSPGRQALKQALARVGVVDAVIRGMCIETFDDLAAKSLELLEGVSTTKATRAEDVKPYVLEAVRRVRERLEPHDASHFEIDGDGSLAVEGLLRSFRHIKGTMQLHAMGPGFRITPGAARDVGRDFSTLAVFAAYEHRRLVGSIDDRRAHDSDGPLWRYQEDATFDLATMIDAGDCAVEPPHSVLAHGWRFVALDEMHDTNRAMIVVLRAVLAANPDAVFLGVGDRDQTIHEEAGADASLMGEGFDREIGRAERLPLDASYRFGAALAEVLGRHAGKTYRSKAARSTVIDVQAVGGPRDQALYVERVLHERIGLSQRAAPGDLAVLLRHPSRAVMLENHLIDRGVDFEAVGFTNYLMRPEVLFVRGVLVSALDAAHLVETKAVHEAIVEAMLFFCAVGAPMETSGRDPRSGAAEQLDASKVARAKSLPNYVRGRLFELVDERVAAALRDAMAIVASNRTADFPRVLDRLDVRRMAARVLVRREDVEAVSDTMAGLAQAVSAFDSIESFIRGCNEREVRLAAMRRRHRVKLSTIEAAKGPEFDHVIVPDVNAGDFDGDSGDERNLFYVAASRAKLRLTLMHASGRPSSFLAAATGPR